MKVNMDCWFYAKNWKKLENDLGICKMNMDCQSIINKTHLNEFINV